MVEMVGQEGDSSAAAVVESHQYEPLAPAWHTVLMVLIILGTSASGYFTTRRYVGTGMHGTSPPQTALLTTYGLTLVLEWFAFFFVRWGERMKKRRREDGSARCARALEEAGELGRKLGAILLSRLACGSVS